MEWMELSYTAVGNAKCNSYGGKCLVVFNTQLKYTYHKTPVIPLFHIYLREMEIYVLKKTCVRHRFIHYSRKLQSTQMAINIWIYNINNIYYIHTVEYYQYKERNYWSYNNMDEKDILCHSTHIKFQKMQTSLVI